jgi:hypothetical protein
MFAVLGALSASAMAADQCEDNFKVEGNMLTGKTYKTSAVMAGVQQDAAFARALAFTVANGFTVTASDKAAGVISAAQTVSFGKGKTVPLGIVFQPDAGNLKMSMNYATSGGVLSPESSIRKHFCMTIAAAADGASPAPAAANTGVVPPPNLGVLPPPNPAAMTQRRPTMPGFASPTAAQQQSYLQAVTKIAPNDRIKSMIKEAAPEISAFIEKVACVTDFKALGAMGAFAAPDANLKNYALFPMNGMKYHDKAQCLTVKRVHGWKAPANNALQFETVYVADDSGESGTTVHEVIRQPDGAWLFTR